MSKGKNIPVVEMDVGDAFDGIVHNLERMFGEPVPIHRKNANGEWEYEGMSDVVMKRRKKNIKKTPLSFM